jgi:DNA-binding CsgD family transcriptional regulator
MDILKLTAQGHTGPDIAQTLHLSLSTVRFHCGKITSILGVRSRTGAVGEAYRLGILSPVR